MSGCGDSGCGRCGFGSYVGHEGISAADRVHNIPPAVVSISECAPQCRDVNSQITLLDDSPRPSARNQFLFREYLTGPLEQRRQEIKCTIAEGNGPSCVVQQALDGPHLERAEANDASRSDFGNDFVVSRYSAQAIPRGLRIFAGRFLEIGRHTTRRSPPQPTRSGTSFASPTWPLRYLHGKSQTSLDSDEHSCMK